MPDYMPDHDRINEMQDYAAAILIAVRALTEAVGTAAKCEALDLTTRKALADAALTATVALQVGDGNAAASRAVGIERGLERQRP